MVELLALTILIELLTLTALDLISLWSLLVELLPALIELTSLARSLIKVRISVVEECVSELITTGKPAELFREELTFDSPGIGQSAGQETCVVTQLVNKLLTDNYESFTCC